MKFSRLQEDPESPREDNRDEQEGGGSNLPDNRNNEDGINLGSSLSVQSSRSSQVGRMSKSWTDRFFASNKIVSLGIVCVVLLAFVAIMLINTRITSYDNFMQVSNHLNETSQRQKSLRDEIQQVGGNLNNIRNVILQLQRNTSSASLQKQLQPKLDRIKAALKTMIKNNTQNIANSEKQLEDGQKTIQEIQSQIEEVLNITNAQIETIFTRIGEVTNSTKDMSIEYNDRHGSLSEEIMDIWQAVHSVQSQVEIQTFQQITDRVDTDKKLKILETTLNMTVNELASAKTDHSQFSNETMGLLKNLMDIMKNDTVAQNSETSDNLGDDVTAQQELTTTEKSDVTLGPDTCNNPKAVPLSMIQCSASSEYSSQWTCKKAIDGVLQTTQPGSAWASKGEGVGAWIKLTFTKQVQIKVIKILQRFVQLEANREVKLEFDGNISERAVLPAKGSRHWNVIKLSRAVPTTSLKITVTEVYGQINNGFKEILFSACF